MAKPNILERAYNEVKSAMPGKKAVIIMCGLGILAEAWYISEN